MRASSHETTGFFFVEIFHQFLANLWNAALDKGTGNHGWKVTNIHFEFLLKVDVQLRFGHLAGSK